MKLTVALPGLFWQDVGDIDYMYPKLPNFDKLFRHAKMSILRSSYSDLIYSFANCTGSLAKSIANQLSYTNNLTQSYSSYLLVEPIHLRIDRDRLQISESEILQLVFEESMTIIKSLNEYFVNEVRFYYINDNFWLLGHNFDLQEVVSYPLIDIIGENIDDYLHLGKNAIVRNKIMNEVQMLLHELPSNRLRKQKGLLPVNSIWMWDKSLKADNTYTSIYANNLTKHFSYAKNVLPIPDSIVDAFVDNNLIVIDNLYYPCCYRDSFSWVDKLNELDNTLGMLLNNFLAHGKINQLKILVPKLHHTVCLDIYSHHKYKIWENKKLIHLVKESNAF